MLYKVSAAKGSVSGEYSRPRLCCTFACRQCFKKRFSTLHGLCGVGSRAVGKHYMKCWRKLLRCTHTLTTNSLAHTLEGLDARDVRDVWHVVQPRTHGHSVVHALLTSGSAHDIAALAVPLHFLHSAVEPGGERASWYVCTCSGWVCLCLCRCRWRQRDDFLRGCL